MEKNDIAESSARFFFKKFNTQVKKNIDEDTYKCKSNTIEFTQKVINIISDIIGESKSFSEEEKSQTEYYRIDVIGYRNVDEKNDDIFSTVKTDLKKSPELWNLDIAVEHENDKKSWKDELIKLCFIRCPLRVVIGYNYCDMRGDPELGDEMKVKYAMELMNQISNHNKSNVIDKDQEFLIIFGNCSGKNPQNDYKDYDYRGYIISSTPGGIKFEKIK